MRGAGLPKVKPYTASRHAAGSYLSRAGVSPAIIVIDPTIVSHLLGRRRRVDPLAGLTEREREVLALVAEGMSNRAIASRLFVTERTVEAHVTQIFLKLRLAETPDQHRRVLAVLAFLRA